MPPAFEVIETKIREGSVKSYTKIAEVSPEEIRIHVALTEELLSELGLARLYPREPPMGFTSSKPHLGF